MALTDVMAFRVSSNLDMPADSFNAELSSSDTFETAVAKEAASLKAGFDGVNYPQLDGFIDSYSLKITPRGFTANASGRDKISRLLDRRVRYLYAKITPSPTPTEVDVVRVGTFYASEIARELVAAVGLTLSWECRDYTLKTDYSAVGRVIDILQDLVSPWSQVEMLKVDIWSRGGTVFARSRPSSFSADNIWDFSVNPTDARIGEISVGKKKLPFIGRVVLHGMDTGAGSNGVAVIQPYEVEVVRATEVKDALGKVTSRTITTERFRYPDEITLSRHSITWVSNGSVLDKDKEEYTDLDYKQPPLYDADGRRLNPPLLLNETTRIWGNVASRKGPYRWEQISSHKKHLGYDSTERLRQSDEEIHEWNESKKVLEPKSKVIKEYSEAAFGMVEEVTSTYGYDSKKGDWTIESTVTQMNSGHLPQFGLSSSIGSAGSTDSKGVTELKFTISTDPYAEDISYSNPHLDLGDLHYILEQFKQVSGKWEYAISFTGVAMPWLLKGSTFQLVNIPLGRLLKTGTVFASEKFLSLPVCMITGREFQYSEGSENPEMTHNIAAVAWSSS